MTAVLRASSKMGLGALPQMRSVTRVIPNVLLILGALSGCARPSISTPPGSPPPPWDDTGPHRCGGSRDASRCGDPEGLGGPDDPLAVALRAAQATDAGDELPLLGGEALHSRSRLALRVRTNRPAYLTLLGRSPGGAVSVLFQSARPLAAGCALRLPQQGWLVLDDSVGDEELELVATQQPVAQLAPGVCAEWRLPCGAPAAPADVDALPCDPAPPPADDARAIDHSIRHSIQHSIRHSIRRSIRIGRDRGQGVAAVRFSFRHVP